MLDLALLYKYVDVVSIENFEGRTVSEIYEDIIEMQKVKIESGEMEALNELEAEQTALSIFEYLQEEQEGQFL